MEQRDVLAPRIFFDTVVALEHQDGESQSGRAYNISLRGVFVRIDTLIPVSTKIVARFALPNGCDVVAEATVVRVCDEASLEPQGVALRFDAVRDGADQKLRAFVEESIRPARGESMRLTFDALPSPVVVRAQADWDDVVAVDAELPFLALGSSVQVTRDAKGAPEAGAIRWVSINVCPDTGVPRLNVGIELVKKGAVANVDEEYDPVLSGDFAEHAEKHDREVRAARDTGSDSED